MNCSIYYSVLHNYIEYFFFSAHVAAIPEAGLQIIDSESHWAPKFVSLVLPSR